MVRKFSSTYPGRMLLLTIILAIFAGGLILHLPICQKAPMSFFDMFFTSASMTCVTGLTPIDLDNFTRIGHWVILLLIQIGGLGIMTMTLTIMSLFINMGLTTQLLAGHILEIENLKHIKKMFIFTLLFTAFVEIVGAVSFLPIFLKTYSINDAIFYSIFHSISSFCNAGVTLFKGGMNSYIADIPMLLITATLTFIGGFGFIACHELLTHIAHKIIFRKKIHKVTLNTKLALYMSLLIVTIVTIIFLLLESGNTLANLTTGQQIVNSFFNAVSMRSVGALTVKFGSMQLATILLIMIISFIGSAPGSTGSGIKTASFAIFIATIKSVLSYKKHVEILSRTIPTLQVYKSLTIITLSLSAIVLTTFFLLITEKSFTFLDILFEAASAVTNLGISSGITEKLSTLGKIFIMLNMIFGRIGSLTLALAFIKIKDTKEFTYPEEKLILS